MNLEQLAKKDLSDFEAFESASFFDPYRVLKSFHLPEGRHQGHQEYLYSFDRTKNSTPPTIDQPNDRKSLKLMLERLNSTISISKKQKEPSTKPSSRVVFYSSTKPVLQRKSQSQILKGKTQQLRLSCHSQKKQNSPGKIDNCQGKIKFLGLQRNSIHSKQERVRTLIKIKLAERQKQRRKNTTSSQVRINRISIKPSTAQELRKTNSRALIDLLC